MTVAYQPVSTMITTMVTLFLASDRTRAFAHALVGKCRRQLRFKLSKIKKLLDGP